MNRPTRLPTLIALAIVSTLACSLPSSSSSPPEPDPCEEPERPDPEQLPPLCDLDGGKWCESCEGEGCPQGDSGALCCAGGCCVVWDGGACGGILGWCNNYTTTKDPDTGVEIATCHE